MKVVEQVIEWYDNCKSSICQANNQKCPDYNSNKSKSSTMYENVNISKKILAKSWSSRYSKYCSRCKNAWFLCRLSISTRETDSIRNRIKKKCVRRETSSDPLTKKKIRSTLPSSPGIYEVWLYFTDERLNWGNICKRKIAKKFEIMYYKLKNNAIFRK